jgi:hypothetical protein
MRIPDASSACQPISRQQVAEVKQAAVRGCLGASRGTSPRSHWRRAAAQALPTTRLGFVVQGRRAGAHAGASPALSVMQRGGPGMRAGG